MIPQKLKKGDKVAVVAPSGKLKSKDLDAGLVVLENWGLEVLPGAHLFDGEGFFSASEENRKKDLQEAIDDPEIKAIFCARGGFGLGKIIDDLQLLPLLKDPKWIVGFSDITLLHFKLHSLGLHSIHGPMVKQFGQHVDNASIQSLKSILFSDDPVVYEGTAHKNNRSGSGFGPLIGGNLTLITNNLGTKSDVEFRGKVLFIEEVNEFLYVVDRHLNQLQRAQKLDHLEALIVGQFTSMKDTDPNYGKSAYDLISEYVDPYHFPVLFDFPAGHGKQNMSLEMSSDCKVIVDKEKASVRTL